MKMFVTLLFCCASAIAADTSLTGVWSAQETFGPAVQGTLTIDGRAATWQASIGGFDVAVARREDAISFALPAGAGEFHGRVGAKTIRGQWIQPAGIMRNSRYATPVALDEVSPHVWRGEVRPLVDRATFVIIVNKATAVIRNPELNLFRRRTFEVSVTGDQVAFTDAKGNALHGTLNGDGFWLPVLDGRPPLVFTRRQPADATPTIYANPPALGDGWQTASLREAGIDEKPITALVRKIIDDDEHVDSLLIARHGKLVFEAYFDRSDRDRPHDMRSASKTFAPLLAGIAAIDSTTRIGKDDITLRDLMTMTSGLACNDNDDKSPGNEDTMQSQTAQPDWYRYTLDLPMVSKPGGHHAIYCSAGINLIGDVVRRTTKTSLIDFFDTHVARPLGFGRYHINLAPTGDAYLAGGLCLRPRDELKLGQIALSGGMWNGTRVVSKRWIEVATTAYARFDPQTDYEGPHDYGYGWHINQLVSGGRTYRAYTAGGNGGQFVMAIPELDLVVGINGSAYGEFAKWYRWGLLWVPQYVIAAVRPSPGAARHPLPAAAGRGKTPCAPSPRASGEKVAEGRMRGRVHFAVEMSHRIP